MNNSFISITAILLALVAGCNAKDTTKTVDAQPTPVAETPKTSAFITHGDHSPVAVGNGTSVSVVVNGETVRIVTNDKTTTVTTLNKDGSVKSTSTTATPNEYETEATVKQNGTNITAQTYGKNSPVVISNGGVSTITYSK